MIIFYHVNSYCFLEGFPLDPVEEVMQNKNEFKYRVKKFMIAKYENFENNKLFC